VQLVLQYDGADFSGWQRQPALRTVQGVVEEALQRLCDAPISALGSGRTDAGVHARGQAVAALGVSMSARCFELEREPLSDALREVADQAAQVLSAPAIPAISEDPVALGRAVRPTLATGPTAVHTPSL